LLFRTIYDKNFLGQYLKGLVMKKKQQIETLVEKLKRPNYFHGQLLLEEDFLAEQSYHISARRRHNLKMHGSGIVSGLEVVRRSDNSVTIKPGYAIDKSGQEIFLDSEEAFELKEFEANDLINISLVYQDGGTEQGSKENRIKSFAVLTAAKNIDDETEILLANVKLDEKGKVGDDSIDYSHTKYAGAIIRPGSITAVELSTELKTGWITMQFRPSELENKPEGEQEIPPAFRVGPTETITPRKEGVDMGAAGTMAIPVPPATKKIKRFRIYGARNEGEIMIRLAMGGWDVKNNVHLAKPLLEKKVTGEPFKNEFKLDDVDIDPEYQTISVRIRCKAKAHISFVAVEFAY
jgi:hypothetical protein